MSGPDFTDQALGAFFTLTVCFGAIGLAALVCAVLESWLEWRRERNQRLPPPNCRARVTRRWNVPE